MTKKVGVIGCGARGRAYMRQLVNELGKEYDIAAIADPSSLAVEKFINLYKIKNVEVFSEGPELLNKLGNHLDAVIITSPNAFHLESLLPAIENKLVTILEKPVATTLEDCKTMWEAYSNNEEVAILVGFVLRYTPFYSKVKEIIDNKQIGDILSIETTEWLGPVITALFKREWRRLETLSGPMIIEKCSHDMDIISWIANSKAKKVSSFATQTRFIPRNDAAENCSECKLAETCRYNPRKLSPFQGGNEPSSGGRNNEKTVNDMCVFNSDKDTPDQQIVNIEFENGILANFSLSLDQPDGGRTIKINGTEGQLFGNFGKGFIKIKYNKKDKNNELVEEIIKIEHNKSGHNGGDAIITEYFKDILKGIPQVPRAGLREGIDAFLIGYAAELSRHEDRVVNMDNLYNAVYNE